MRCVVTGEGEAFPYCMGSQLSGGFLQFISLFFVAESLTEPKAARLAPQSRDDRDRPCCLDLILVVMGMQIRVLILVPVTH